MTPDSSLETRPAVRSLSVTSPDGATVVLRVYEAASPSAPLALVLPAMGIEGRYYERFALALAEAGVCTVLSDLRGSGTSNLRASRTVDFGYAELVRNDLPAWLSALSAELGPRSTFLVGHSLGGQLALLHAASREPRPAGLVLIATSSAHFRSFPRARALRVLAGSQLTWLVAEALGHFPGQRLGFGGREARRLMREWAHLARTGRYQLRGLDDAERQLRSLSVPVLSVTLEDDALAPPSAVQAMLQKLPRAPVTHFHYVPGQHGLPPTDHNRWPRQPAIIAANTARFILREAGTPAP